MRAPASAVVLLLGALACAPDRAPCGPAECAPICAAECAEPAGGGGPFGLDAAQAELLAPLAEDLAAGVRPWDDRSTGICAGQGKSCERFLGLRPEGPLPEGRYMLRAELRVPEVGPKGTWKVRYELACEVVIPEDDGERTRSFTRSKTYDLRYVGEDRGYRLSPLHTIESPRDEGTETCSYTLTGLGPTRSPPLEGGWTVGPPEVTPPASPEGAPE